MAKGFTVKTAAPPKTNTDDFDLAAAKELVKGKTIVFCLPGRGVSYIFLKAFVQLCFDIVQRMVRLLQWHIGWRKTISVLMAV